MSTIINPSHKWITTLPFDAAAPPHPPQFMSMAQNMMKDPNMMKMAEVNKTLFPKFIITYSIEAYCHPIRNLDNFPVTPQNMMKDPQSMQKVMCCILYYHFFITAHAAPSVVLHLPAMCQK